MSLCYVTVSQFRREIKQSQKYYTSLTKELMVPRYPQGRVFLLLPQCSWYLLMQVTHSQRAKITIPHLHEEKERTFSFQVL